VGDNYPKYVLTLNELSNGNYEGVKSMHIGRLVVRRIKQRMNKNG